MAVNADAFPLVWLGNLSLYILEYRVRCIGKIPLKKVATQRNPMAVVRVNVRFVPQIKPNLGECHRDSRSDCRNTELRSPPERVNKNC